MTDVGNDVLYGMPADRIVTWVDEAIGRLQRITGDIVLTDLPLARARRLSRFEFLTFRSLVVPQCRLSLAEVLETAERVNEGLEALAAARGVSFFRLKPEWARRRPHPHPAIALALRLAGNPLPRARRRDDRIGSREVTPGGPARLYLLRPERQWLFGREQFTPQHGVPLSPGGRVWLY